MAPHHVILLGLLLALHGTMTHADGRLTYGDKCSVQNAILSVFINTDSPSSEKCDSSKDLICTGTCTCPPTRVWEKGFFFGLFGGNRCIVGANGPCGKNDECVANAVCGDSLPLCFCREGYYAHDLQCISGYGHNRSSGSTCVKYAGSAYIITLLLIAAKLITS